MPADFSQHPFTEVATEPSVTEAPTQHPSYYLHQDVAVETLGDMNQRLLFVGIDLAPIDTLETGVAVLDRNRKLLRMEKLSDNQDIIRFVMGLDHPSRVVISLDPPKSLNIPSKWRQHQIKMFALRQKNAQTGTVTDRFSERALRLYTQLHDAGFLILNSFSHSAKARFGLNTPFRSRSPQGCQSLQNNIQQHLNIKGLPGNLVPTSVLDAMIGAYSAWLLCQGQEGVHYKLYQGDDGRLYLDPLQLKKLERRRR